MSGSSEAAVARVVRLPADVDLHARPAGVLVRAAATLETPVTLRANNWKRVRVDFAGNVIAFHSGPTNATGPINPDDFCYYSFQDVNGVATNENSRRGRLGVSNSNVCKAGRLPGTAAASEIDDDAVTSWIARKSYERSHT